jgi:hypothetical protein
MRDKKPVTVQRAILIGAAIIAVAILGSQLIAPYRLAATPGYAYRINAITGTISECDYSYVHQISGKRCE